MKKAFLHHLPKLAAAVLVTAALLGMALAAGQQGSQSNPLVTVSYLKDTLTPELLAQTDAKLAQREEELTASLQGLIDRYSKEMADKLSAAGGDVESAVFEVVTLPQNQRIIGGVGCELLLRSGSANCVSASTPGLIDTTGGGTLANGGALAANHLYMVTSEGIGLVATGDSVVLVRGSYTVE